MKEIILIRVKNKTDIELIGIQSGLIRPYEGNERRYKYFARHPRWGFLIRSE